MSPPLPDPAVLRDRRARVLAVLGERAALVLGAAPELRVGRDTELRYAVDADVYYLTGYVEPEAVLVLAPAVQDAPFTMFVRPRDPARELWTGTRGGVEAARERFGADAAHPITELAARLPDLLGGVDTLYARPDSGNPALDRSLPPLLADARHRRARRGTGIHTIVEPGVLLDDMRLYKDEGELALMREAARITVAAFEDARRVIRTDAGEWEVEAALEGGFRARGASGPAFPSIVASGANATVLHYIANERRMQAGDVVLLDAGARFGMYCADVSRTYAVGAVSPPVRALHAVVRAAHDAAIAAVHPGARIADVHAAATGTLADGCVDLGLLPRALEPDARAEALRHLYPHQTSHWLGLDVHDVGDYVRAGASRTLEPGMVLTVEPGLYVPATLEGAPPELRGVGVRLEDAVVVVAGGGEVLTGGLSLELG